MRILVFEPFAAGHRLQFVRMCVEAAGGLGDEIIFATAPSTLRTDDFRIHLQPIAERLTIDSSMDDAPTTQWRSSFARLHGLRGVLRRTKPDHVYIPYGDGLAQMCGATRGFMRIKRPGMEIEAIMMRGRFAYPSSGWRDRLWLATALAATRRAPFDVFHLLDPIPYDAIMRHGADTRFARRCRLIPEPVEQVRPVERAEARRRLRLPESGRWIACPGFLDERKGADRLIRAFAQADLRDDDRLLLAGHMEPSIQRVLEAHGELVRSGRIIAMQGCLSDEDLHLSMSAADVVCVPYPRHIGSSGIIVRAAALQRMVLASDFGWVGMVTQRFGLGATCDCTSDQRLAEALPRALESAASFRMTEPARRFTQFHTHDNFAAHISLRLRQRLNMPAPANMKTWAWVLEADSEQGIHAPGRVRSRS